jgi:NRPS condensation-like uncharacterized protein
VFIQSANPDRLYDQVVLRTVDPWILSIVLASEDPSSAFPEQGSVTAFMGRAPHRLTICSTPSNRVYCKIELNHAIVDGASLVVILQDLSAAYSDKLNVRKGEPFGEYVEKINALDHGPALQYWKEYLAGLEPCHIKLNVPDTMERRLRIVNCNLDIDANSAQAFCEQYGVTMSNIIQTAWGLVLRQYTGLKHVSFGCLSSGRDASTEQDVVGPYLAMLICRMNLESNKSLAQVIESTRDDFTRSVPHQNCSLADIQHALGLSSALFNTVMSIQKRVEADSSKNPSLLIDLLDQHDPTEVG